MSRARKIKGKKIHRYFCVVSGEIILGVHTIWTLFASAREIAVDEISQQVQKEHDDGTRYDRNHATTGPHQAGEFFPIIVRNSERVRASFRNAPSI